MYEMHHMYDMTHLFLTSVWAFVCVEKERERYRGRENLKLSTNVRSCLSLSLSLSLLTQTAKETANVAETRVCARGRGSADACKNRAKATLSAGIMPEERGKKTKTGWGVERGQESYRNIMVLANTNRQRTLSLKLEVFAYTKKQRHKHSRKQNTQTYLTTFDSMCVHNACVYVHAYVRT